MDDFDPETSAGMTLIAYFDGLCEPNPGGHACAGVYLPAQASLKNEELALGKYCGHGIGMTDNVAEYHAVLLVLELLWKHKYRGVVVLRGDSQFVVNQTLGKYACNADRLKPLLTRMRAIVTHFKELTFEWVSKGHWNQMKADEQSWLAYRKQTGREVPMWERGQ
jgi:ribonuclease HI